MSRTIWATAAVSLLVSAAANAGVVVPNSAAGVEGDGTFSLTSTAAAGRTFQLAIAAGQLSALVGQSITGLEFRLNGAATAAWPPTGASFAQWDISVGPGVAPGAMSNTFAANFSSAPTLVRSGPLAFAAGAFPIGGAPNPFGPTINFTTPYAYAGGDLTIEMRFSAQTGATTQSPLDAVLASGGPVNGWGVDFAGRWVSGSTATTGGNANFLVTNLVAVPAPASLALFGVMGLASRRRRA